MFFEYPEKCPLLEDQESMWGNIPYCTAIYNELTVWVLEELCYKNFIKCPTYIKNIVEMKKNRPAE